MQDKVFANDKIKVVWDSTVEEIRGDATVHSVVLKSVKDGSTKEMPIDGVFAAIGHEPNTGLFAGQLRLDELKYIVTHDEVKTDIDGVYVAGDVADRVYRQAGTASGSGIKAALAVRAYISEQSGM
jgi:thioredoxin reductase (NADPH)